MAGRPTKLTPALQKKIVKAIEEGAYQVEAAQEAGNRPETPRWLHTNREPYLSFAQAVQVAEGKACGKMVRTITRAARDDPKCAMWWLERKFPERWGRKDQHRIADHEGKEYLPLDLLRQAVARSEKRDTPPDDQAEAAS